MAGLSAHGKTLVGNFRRAFEEEYGVPVRVYHGVKFAKDDATLASIRVEDHSGGREVELHGNMKVGNAEAKVLEAIGIRIQIEDGRGGLANNDSTLGSLRGGTVPTHPASPSGGAPAASAPSPTPEPTRLSSSAPAPSPTPAPAPPKSGCVIMLAVGMAAAIVVPASVLAWLV